MQRVLAVCRFLLLPGGLVLAASALLLETTLIDAALRREVLAAVPPYASALLLATGMLLALWFHQLRLATALGSLLLVERGVAWLAGTTSMQPDALRLLAIAALLLNLAWIGLLPTRSGFSLGALWPFTVVGGVGLILAAAAGGSVLGGEAFSRADLIDSWFESLPAGWRSPSGSRGAFAVGTVTLVALSPYWVRIGTQRSAVDRGIAWSSIAALVALFAASGTVGEGGSSSAGYWLAAGVVGLLTLFEASHRLAYFDELTGLPARRALQDALGELRGRYAIAMVDVDHFKRFNDRHGHAVGDEVLRAVATRLSAVGGGGRAYRYGGEEFSILFPGLRAKDAVSHLEELRGEIETAGFSVRGRDRRRKRSRGRRRGVQRKVSITVSAGVAEPTARRRSPAAVLKAADAALYRAKKKGRNRVNR